MVGFVRGAAGTRVSPRSPIPPRMRRHGNTSACGPYKPMTASSSARSNGALTMRCQSFFTAERVCPDGSGGASIRFLVAPSWNESTLPP